MNFMFEGMSEAELNERKNDIQSELEYAKITHAFESNYAMHELRLGDIEQRIILENMSLDDATALYENENEVFSEAVGDIVKKFFDWLAGIIKAIFGIKNSVEVPEEQRSTTIDLPIDPKAANAGAKSFISKIKQWTSVKDETGKLKPSAIVFDGILGLGAITGISAFIKAVNKPTKMTAGEAKAEADELAKNADEIAKVGKSVVEKLDEKDQKDATDSIGSFEKFVRDALQKIMDKLPGNKKSEDGESKTDNGGKKETPNADNNDSNDGNESDNTDDENKDDGKTDDDTNNDSSDKGSKENKTDKPERPSNDIEGRFSDRKKALIDKIDIDGKNKAHCSIDMYQKYVTDEITKLEKANKSGELSRDDINLNKKTIGWLKTISRDSKGGQVTHQTLKNKRVDEEVEINLKKHCKLDEDGNAHVSKDKIKEVMGYYQNMIDNTSPSDRNYQVATIAIKRLQKMKSVDRDESEGEDLNGRLTDDVITTIRNQSNSEVNSKLHVNKVSRPGGGTDLKVTVTKEEAEKYLKTCQNQLTEIKNSEAKLKKEKPNDYKEDKRYKEILRKRIAAETKVNRTSFLINHNKDWSGTNTVGSSSSDGKDINRKIVMGNEKDTRGNMKGFDISETDGKYTTSLTQSQFDKKIKGLEQAAAKEKDPTTKANIEEQIRIAKSFKEHIFTNNGNANSKDNSNLESKAISFMKNELYATSKATKGGTTWEIGNAIDNINSNKALQTKYKNIYIEALYKIKLLEGSIPGVDSNNFDKELAKKLTNIIAHNSTLPSWVEKKGTSSMERKNAFKKSFTDSRKNYSKIKKSDKELLKQAKQQQQKNLP